MATLHKLTIKEIQNLEPAQQVGQKNRLVMAEGFTY